MKGIRHAALALAVAGAVPAAAFASQITYNINATGAKEVTAGGVPNQGDPDAAVIGTLLLNNGTGTGSTGFATINLTLTNLDEGTVNLTGNHIHQAAANTTGAIVLDFGDPDTIRTGNVLLGTISSLSATQITAIFANPTGFYYNIHNATFPNGAARDQLPEPSSLMLLGVGGLLLGQRRRRRDNQAHSTSSGQADSTSPRQA